VVSDILAEELKRELMKGMVGIDDLRAMRGLKLRPRRFEAGAERSVVFEKVWKALMRVGMDGKRIEDGSYIVGAEGRRASWYGINCCDWDARWRSCRGVARNLSVPSPSARHDRALRSLSNKESSALWR
jgi:hypothetical protein